MRRQANFLSVDKLFKGLTLGLERNLKDTSHSKRRECYRLTPVNGDHFINSTCGESRRKMSNDGNIFIVQIKH